MEEVCSSRSVVTGPSYDSPLASCLLQGCLVRYDSSVADTREENWRTCWKSILEKEIFLQR